MSLLARSLLWAAGFGYDAIEETWVAHRPLRPLVAFEFDEGRAYIREALMEVQATLDGIGCVYNNFVVNDHFVSVAGSMHGTMNGNAGGSSLTEPSSPVPLLVGGNDRGGVSAIVPMATY
jgi:hypothetical protein